MIKDEIFSENDEIDVSRAEELLKKAEYNLKLITPKYQKALKRVEWCKEQIRMASEGRYYVYIVFSDGNPVYVGKGKGDRYKHPISGTSSCLELNRDYFLGNYIEVRFISKYLSEQKALDLEKYWVSHIKALSQMCEWDCYNKCNTEPDYQFEATEGEIYHAHSKFAICNDKPKVIPGR